MRKLFGFIFCLALFLTSLNLSSCKDNDSKSLGDYIIIRNFSDFKKIVDSDAQIVDCRCCDSFKLGHVPGAVNIVVDRIENIDYDSGSCLAIESRFSKDRAIFLYGDNSISSAVMMSLAGHVSNLGWGGSKTYYYVPGYEGWVENEGEIETGE